MNVGNVSQSDIGIWLTQEIESFCKSLKYIVFEGGRVDELRER
jgi:hypothetical protein